MGNKITRIKVKNFEKWYNQSMKSNGFIITDELPFDKKIFFENGIHSNKYGTSWRDTNAFEERYSCDCKELKGTVNEGEYCEKCKSVVKARNLDITIIGWLVKEDADLIHPGMYGYIESFIGSKHLLNILMFNKGINKKGNITEYEIDPESKDKTKYYGIGMVEFKNRFMEIMDFYMSINKYNANKKQLYKVIMSHIDDIFIRHYPVFSSILRPMNRVDYQLDYDNINCPLSILQSEFYLLNNEPDFKDNTKMYLTHLFRIQSKILLVDNKIEKILSKKRGLIRSNIMSTRYNFTARCVIVPASKIKTNETIISYSTFLELYKLEIINLLVKIEKMTVYKATSEVNKAKIFFNKKIYQIMKLLIQKSKGGLYIFINRNPTINYGSMICMRIKDVSKDYYDYTLYLPVNVLSALGADFDGDVLNIFCLKGRDMIQKANSIYNPRTNMFVSRNDGLFNNQYNLIKDQLIGLYQFMEL